MRIPISGNCSWLEKITAVRLVLFLLAQFAIGLFCVPGTVRAGSKTHHDVAWEALSLLNGEHDVTIRLSEGGAVRGDVVTVREAGIHLHRITMATDRERFPGGSDALIPKDSVREIRVEKMRSSARIAGGVLGGLGSLLMTGAVIYHTEPDPTPALWFALLGSSVGGGSLGYWLGKRWDRETTIITITD